MKNQFTIIFALFSVFFTTVLFVPAVTASADPHSIRIGDFYYNAPNGIAFIKDDAAAFVIDPGGPDAGGEISPDGSYQRALISPIAQSKKDSVEFEWSRVGDAVVARIRAQNPESLEFDLRKNWPGFSSQYSAAPNGVVGVAKTATGNVTWSLQTKPAPKSADGSRFTLSLGGAEAPAYLVAGFGALPGFDRIDAILAAARAAYETRRPRAEGPSGDIVGAITDNLNGSRIYSTDNNRLAVSVSRSFGVRGANDAPYFCWDSFFSALLASLDNIESAHDTVRAILASQSADGLVPNFTHWGANGESSSMDRSQPPVGAMCVWKTHQRWPDVDFLREVYPKLALWHSWWLKRRNAKGDGLLEWGSGTGSMQDALYETGWDDTPQFRGAGVKMVGQTMNVYAVDLNSLWAMDAQYLGLIADNIGKPDDAKMYRDQADDMIGRMNAKLWNEKLGIYCSRLWNNADGSPGEFLTRLTPANFYPLITGAPTADQAKRMLAIMTDPTQFWGEWILPTVSRRDPLFFQQSYWHGTAWGPVNYLVWLGLKRYAPPEIKAEFAEKSVHLFMNNWLATGQCGENFLTLNGRVGGNPHYTWGALLCLIGVESVIDIQDDGSVLAGTGYNEPVRLLNIPVGGKPYGAEIKFKSESSVGPVSP